MIDGISLLLLGLTVVLSTGRNLLSKNISSAKFKEKTFFGYQTAIFLGGGALLFLLSNKTIPSLLTVLLAIVYAVFLLLAQWCYTCALSKINLSICSTVYSFGFVIPTILGAIIWKEQITIFDVLGLILVIFAIFVSGYNKNSQNKNSDKKYFITLIVAMMASGGLGLIQKLQQNLPYSEQKDIFVTIAFFIAGIVSLIWFFSVKTNKTQTIFNKGYIYATLTGLCFASCNLLNTILAGRLDSALFFPLQNISVILLSIIVNRIINKEKLTLKSGIVFALGVLSIILLNV